MKKAFLYLFYVLLLLTTPSVYAKNYTSLQIERFVNKTPHDTEKNISSLVSYLTKPFDNDYDKAKAIAFWIASHIYYDEYLYNNGSATRLRKNYLGQDARELLRSRVGICGDFAELFETMCKKAGIRVGAIHGYAYPANKYLSASTKHNSGHVWNYFIYNGDKFYVDTTFMAKGSTGIKGSASQLGRRRAINNIRKKNKKESKINEFDKFYFDFNYKDEEYKRRYKRKER